MPTTLVDDDGRQIKLLRALGKGGFGSVWQAEVTSGRGLIHHMAVKLLHEELMADDDLVARANDEARLMSQLNHDHVVKIHALTRLHGRAAVLMEYVEGIDCTALLNAERKRGEPGLPMTIGLAIIERSAAALDAAWNTISPHTGRPLHVVHRDIKPSNLLVSVTGVVKVMDFGVARAEFEREAETQSVQFGTQRFMAPERWLRGVAGPESDVFSLGVTLWELLVGARFERLPLQEVLYDEKRQEQIRTLEWRTPLDPAGLGAAQELLGEMLSFHPDKRPTAAQVEERTSDLLERTRGPDLRRWARKHVPPLVEARVASLDGDSDLAEFTGTLSQEVGPATPATLSPAEPTLPPATLSPAEPTLPPATLSPAEPTLPPETLSPAEPTMAPATLSPAEPTRPPQEPTGGTTRPDLPQPAPGSNPTPERPRSPLFAGVAIGLLVVLGLGGAAVWTLNPSGSVDESPEDVPTEEPVVVDAATPIDEPDDPVELASADPTPDPTGPRRAAPTNEATEATEGPATEGPPAEGPAAGGPPAEASATREATPEDDAAPEPAEEPITAVVRVTERPTAVETVTVKVLADPSDGYVQIGGQRVDVRQTATLTVGETADMTFHWPDAQTVRCQKQITSDLTKIKFEQGAAKCTYSF